MRPEYGESTPPRSFKKLIQALHTKMTQENWQHDPVMMQESLEFLDLQPGQVVVDATLGLGGHSREFLKAIGPTGHLYGFDWDERNIALALPRLKEMGDHFTVYHDSFGSLKDRLRREGVSQVDKVFFDLGLSSPHLDDAERGFSFAKEGPLDMRFDQNLPMTAADFLNGMPEKDLADIFYLYGEETRSRKLAKAIVEDRKKESFKTTLQFAGFLERVLGKGSAGKHSAPRLFQALRIAVNEELKALELGLNQAIELLAPHGRVVVLSYHSLEDRFVKQTFKQLATDLRDPNDLYGRRVLRLKNLSLLNKKPILPSAEEVSANPRARSAKLRAAEKL